MRPAPAIELTTQERHVRENTVRSSRSAVRDVFRARIVLLAADGWESRDIAAELGTGQDTVSRWRRRFAQQRLAGLTERPGRGRKRQYTDQTVERIVEDTLQTTPAQATHWSTRSMAKHAGLSHTTVQRVWRAHALRPHLLRTFKLSNDKHFMDKLRDVVGLYLNPPEHALVYCVDEKSQAQALDRTQAQLPLKQGRCGIMADDYKRHGTTTLVAALNVLEGMVIGKCYSRHRHIEYLRFLGAVDRQMPAGLDIHLIVDNYSTHKHERIKAWLKRRPRFHVHFIPTSSSWLNLVERFFQDITDSRLSRGIFKSVRQLTLAASDFLESYNDNPRPFVWTKTAHQILDKGSPFCANRG